MPLSHRSALLRGAVIAAVVSYAVTSADAQRARGTSGGARASASTQHRSAKTGSAHRTGSATHRTTSASRQGGTNRSATVNNVNVNRNVNVSGNGYSGIGYRPVARAATVGAVAVTRGAIIGSAYHSLPSNCATVVRPAGTYHHCGSAWYQSQNGEYIVVHQP
jgi:hypothetical protein